MGSQDTSFEKNAFFLFEKRFELTFMALVAKSRVGKMHHAQNPSFCTH